MYPQNSLNAYHNAPNRNKHGFRIDLVGNFIGNFGRSENDTMLPIGCYAREEENNEKLFAM